MMWAFLLAVGCKGLDGAPILVGYHCADARDATVLDVLDGDTIVVLGADGVTEEHVRYLGVDADEIAHNPQETAECWGDEAFAWNKDLLLGQAVHLEFDKICQDKYLRTLAYIWLPGAAENGDDLLVNEDIIREGQAVVYEDFDDIRWAPVLYQAQSYAEDNKLGLWAACK